jgi:hypothetical protein
VRDWLYLYYCGAGGGARSKFDEASGRWRKRVFRRVWPVFVGLAIPVLVSTGLAQQRIWIWLSGVVLGALIGVFMTLRESPPAYIENWRTGYEGERRTARALAPLRRRGYSLLHDLPDRRTREKARKGNIDHVVVSAGGVFLLDSKWLGGQVSINGDTVHVQRRDDEDESYDQHWLACGMRGRALRLQEDIEQLTGVRFIQAVVVFWNDFEAGLVTGNNVVFVHGDRLVGWLEEQTSETSPETVARITEAIKAVRPPEHRAWWDRLGSFRFGNGVAPVASSTSDGSGDAAIHKARV